jgi:hypothetical protein
LPASLGGDDNEVALTVLGGGQKAPLEGLKVTIRQETGDWTAGLKKKVADRKTDTNGHTVFTLAEGGYYVDLDADMDVPYPGLPAGFKGHPSHLSRRIKVGTETAFEFNPADARRLTLRAVDADTGEGIPGVVSVTTNELAKARAPPVNGDNLGAKILVENWTDDSLKPVEDGNFARFMGPRPGYAYYAWTIPPGYELPDKRGEVTLERSIGTDMVGHVFKLKRKK